MRNFLVANALYWLEEFHVDGLRVDAVASMLYLDYSRNDGEWAPNVYGGRENLEAIAFLQEMNATVYRRVPGVVTIAEESTAWPGVTRPTHLGRPGLRLQVEHGLDARLAGVHEQGADLPPVPPRRDDVLDGVRLLSENYVLPISHDEVVHGKGSLLRKMPGDRWQQLANLRAFLAYMWAHPGKQLLFMGSRVRPGGRVGREPLPGLVAPRATRRTAGVQQLVRDLNALYREHAALWSLDVDPAGFQWIDANDSPRNMLSFLRSARTRGRAATRWRVRGQLRRASRTTATGSGCRAPGRWREVLNTDAERLRRLRASATWARVEAVAEPWHGRPASARRCASRRSARSGSCTRRIDLRGQQRSRPSACLAASTWPAASATLAPKARSEAARATMAFRMVMAWVA